MALGFVRHIQILGLNGEDDGWRLCPNFKTTRLDL